MNKAILNTSCFVGAALAASAQAQQFFPTGPQANELILNIRAYGGNTQPNNLGIDIGPVSAYPAVGTPFNVPGVNATDLKSLFGTGLTEIRFSISGYGDNADGTVLYMSNPTVSPWNRKNTSSQTQVSANIESTISGYLSAAGSVFNPYSRTIPASNGASYTSYIGSGNYGTFQGNIEGDTGTSFASAITLGLYKLDPWTAGGRPTGTIDDGQLLGTFALAQSGVMTYTPMAVPEPSTVAFGVVSWLMALGVVLRRRSENCK